MTVIVVNENDDNIVERWKMTGLLEGIPEEEEKTLAHLLHAAVLYLRHDKVEEKICAILLPTVRRIYDINKNGNIHFKKLHKMLEIALENGPTLICRCLNIFKEIDCQNEAVKTACNKYVKKYTR